MMLMTNDLLAQQFGEADGEARVSPLPPRPTLHALPDAPARLFVVAVEQVVVAPPADPRTPVRYALRVSSRLHSASWTLTPHRYSDFEALHEAAAKRLDADERSALAAQLPAKHLLLRTRQALTERAAGLRRYCEALLNSPAALCDAEVATFFELDDNLWRQKRAASADERAEAAVRLQTACRHRRSGSRPRLRSRVKQERANVEADTTLRNAKRGVEQTSAAARREGDAGRHVSSKWAYGASPGRSSRAPPPGALEQLDGLPVMPEPVLLQRAKCGSVLFGRPSEPRRAAGDDGDANDGSGALADLPLKRSGVSDVVAGLAL
jgi:hypothetical protein